MILIQEANYLFKIEKSQEELIIISYIESMHLFSKKPDKPETKNKKQENKLTKYIQLIQNIQRYKDDAQKVFIEMQQYDNCKDIDKKQLFRQKVKYLISQLNKQVNFYHLIKQTLSAEQKMNKDIARYQYTVEARKLEKQLEQKIQKLNVLQTINASVELPNFLNMKLQNKIIEMKQNSIKYSYILKAMQTFEKRQRNFVEYMGQADLRLFQVPQYAIFDNFTKRINKGKIQIFSINVQKQLQIISNTIDEMQNVYNLQEIQKIQKKNIKKIDNQGFFLKLIGKQKQKLTIFQFIFEIQKSIGNSPDQLSLGKYIKMNLDLKPKIKTCLESINSKLLSISKCQQIFQQNQMEMTQQKVQQIFLYLGNLQKMLKTSIQQLEQKVSKNKVHEHNFKEESPKYLNLSKYFQRLIKLIDLAFVSNSSQPKQPDNHRQNFQESLTKNDESLPKLKQELNQKQKSISNLSWRVNNLVPQLQKEQKQKNILERNLEQLKKEANQNKIWKDKYDKVVLQLQSLKKNTSQNAVISENKPKNKWEKYQNDLKNYGLQQKVEKLEIKNKQYQKQIKLLKQNAQKLQYQNSELQNQLKIQKQKKITSQHNNQMNLTELQSFDDRINKIKELKYLHYFFGPIFKSQFEHSLKQHLISHIYETTGRDIVSTERIYALDKKNPVSPHKYIDGVSDWLLLFKLRNGYIIGGFCRDPITPVRREDFVNQGFMFSLNGKKFYNLLSSNGKSTIYQYNEYYLIIGNSEIRFNLQTHLVENQFGGKFKYFQTGRDTAEIFFGSNDEKFEIETYQFYRLIFSEKQK